MTGSRHLLAGLWTLFLALLTSAQYDGSQYVSTFTANYDNNPYASQPSSQNNYGGSQYVSTFYANYDSTDDNPYASQNSSQNNYYELPDDLAEWANNPICTLKVLFLTYNDSSPEDELYAQGFRFWAQYANLVHLRLAGAVGDLKLCIKVEPYFDTLTPEEGVDTQGWNVTSEVIQGIGLQVDGWVTQGVRLVILGVRFEDCAITRRYLQLVGLHHFAVNVKDWFVFRRQSSPRMWGIGSTHMHTVNGFVDLTARSTARGVCLVNDDFDNYISDQITRGIWRAYEEVGVQFVFEEYSNVSLGVVSNLSSLAIEIARSGCDTLILLLKHPGDAVILHQELASLRAPLSAEFIWPELNTTVWKELGRMGEQVFSATEWHHDAMFKDSIFQNPGEFVRQYRLWLKEASGEDRVPTAQEAASVAAGMLILEVCLTLWDGQNPFMGFDYPPPSDVGPVGFAASADEEDQFGLRFGEGIAQLDNFQTFYGTMHFDNAGVNVGKRFVTLQYLQDARAVTVHPREVRAAAPILPMDSFEARQGCPAGTYFVNRSDEEMWRVPGVRCSNCSRLQYQNKFNQTGCLSCLPGEFSGEGASSCEQCPPGRFRLDLQEECAPCFWGSFSQSSGASFCDRCPAGRFAARPGESECQPCPPGTFAQEPGGKRECSPCELGFFNNLFEQASCTACARDSYAEELGSRNCTACPETFGTEDIASGDRGRCLCPPGSYWHKATPNSEPFCERRLCEESLQCKGWSRDAPIATAGYSVGPPGYEGAEPAYVVICANTQDCPGDLEPGTCPDGHEDARSCAECEAGYARHGQGGCSKCEGVKWYLPLLLLSIAACLVGVALYGLRFTENNVPAESAINITAVIGIVVTSLQILSVFRFIHIKWPQPIEFFHTLYATVTNPLEVFISLGCILPLKSAFHSYLLLMSVWPAAALYIFIMFKLAGVFSKYYRAKITNVHIFHMEGMLVLLFSTSISMFSLSPWQCETNPDGTSSVVAYRQVLCWSGSVHAGMIAFSSVAILFIVGFLSLLAWATYRYPIKVTRPKGGKFLFMFRWIFNRFKPHSHYYGLIYCSRNLLVTVLPVIFVDNIPVQFLLVASILQFSLIFQCWNKPWITDLANKFDAASTVLLILLLIVGSLLISTAAAELAFILSGFVGTTFSIFGVALTAGLAHNLFRQLTPHKEFAFFLCHHKVAAAVLARWVKIELQLRNQGHVFLDSDELNRLDRLFDVVAHETQNLVVLLTNETLSRIWCAGEITTALRHKVKITCIACNDYTEPTDDFINNLGKIWTDAQVTEVSRQGVSLEQIKEAFVQFRELPKIKHDRRASFQRQMRLIDTLMASGRSVPPKDLMSHVTSQATDAGAEFSKPLGLNATTVSVGKTSRRMRQMAKTFFTLPNVASHDHQRNLMVGNLDDPEAFLVSRVLQLQLQQVLQSGVVVASKKTPEALEQLATLKPSFLVAVLTAGVLAKPSFAVILATVRSWQQPPTFVPVVADSKFVFPDSKFWESLEDGSIVDPQVLQSHQLSIDDVVQAYKALFLVISKRFSSHGSEKIQLTEVTEIADLWPLSRIPSSNTSRTP